MNATAVTPVARIEADGLTHRFGARTVLRELRFSMQGPGILAVTGPNGSGKSTLLRIAAGLLRPSDGRVRLTLDGREVAPAVRRDHLGFASPDVTFYEELSAEENLCFAAEALGVAGGPVLAREALTRVGLGARAGDRVLAFSSGMKQRLRLAFALLRGPRVLLLDEPGSHLDDGGRTMLQQLLEDLRATALVVLATNDEREWSLGDERIELHDGDLGNSP